MRCTRGLVRLPLRYENTAQAPCCQGLVFIFKLDEIIEIYAAPDVQQWVEDILGGLEPDLNDATHFAFRVSLTGADELEAIAEYSFVYKRLPRGYKARFIPRLPTGN